MLAREASGLATGESIITIAPGTSGSRMRSSKETTPPMLCPTRTGRSMRSSAISQATSSASAGIE